MGGEPVKDCSRAPPPPLSRGGPLEDSLLLVHSPPARFSIKKAVDEEIDAASAAVCRICFDHGPGDELISPCMCKGTQQFVHRSCLDHWRSVKILVTAIFLFDFQAIAAISGMSYLQDKDGKFRNSFTSDWVRILSKHPVPFYYCIGVVVFFALVGLIGFIWHCCTCPPSNNNYDSPRLVVYSNRGSDSEDKDCFAAVVVLIIIFAIVGIEFVVEDLQGGYTPPKMNPEHKQRLKLLQLM
ncbi:hypothetical protein U9M48_018569 [Paspalum notatum var. saurae]|uniref:RING-CH-type domain-containing protein n=1 Tax=Paspalum notatum var. saurae TaxID=547442 RepID=A0AAQ3TC05_PASNO